MTDLPIWGRTSAYDFIYDSVSFFIQLTSGSLNIIAFTLSFSCYILPDMVLDFNFRYFDVISKLE